MFRCRLAVALITVAVSSMAFGQTYPAYRWDVQVDASDLDSFTGLAVDAQGNTYIAGSTFALNFPTKSPAQKQSMSAGLFRIDGTGAPYTRLGLISASSVIIDPVNPSVVYAISSGPLPGTDAQAGSGNLMKSTDAGATFSVILSPVLNLKIDPSNDQILYAVGGTSGISKSTNGGATWMPMNSVLSAVGVGPGNVWVDPGMPNILLASEGGDQQTLLVRSANGGLTWQNVQTWQAVYDSVQLYFDGAVPGTIYAAVDGLPYKSADHGQSFQALTPAPASVGGFSSIVSDPNQPGRLLASPGIYESDDDGVTWTLKTQVNFLQNGPPLAPDWDSGYLYVAAAPGSLLRISSDLQTVAQVGPPRIAFPADVTGGTDALAAANGSVYVAATATHDVYVTKLDPLGNVVYSTYFGGSADDVATAMTADPSGNVYVGGTTTSLDFPVTSGAYAATAAPTPTSPGSSFLFKLNPDGSLGYSTYFAPSPTIPAQIAVDATGAAYLAGTTAASVPTTPGALETSPAPAPAESSPSETSYGFITKFDPTGSSLVYSTYIGGDFAAPLGYFPIIGGLALGPDGSAYLGGMNGIYHLDASGSSLLATLSVPGSHGAGGMTLGPDGSVYAVVVADSSFDTTTGAFQTTIVATPTQGFGNTATWWSALMKMDPALSSVEAASFFGVPNSNVGILTPQIDSAGNVYIAGSSPQQGLPTRTPFQLGFAQPTGFLSELTGDLTTLLFSTYLGDSQMFEVTGLALAPSGSVVIGGSSNPGNYYGGNTYVNSLTLEPPAPLRIDSVVSASSMLDGSISPAETIVIEGAGFGSDASVSIGGVPAVGVSVTSPSAITAVVPSNVPAVAAEVQVQSGGASSNQILVPVTTN